MTATNGKQSKMDELLELMEDNIPEEGSPLSPLDDEQAGIMDELVSLMDENPPTLEEHSNSNATPRAPPPPLPPLPPPAYSRQQSSTILIVTPTTTTTTQSSAQREKTTSKAAAVVVVSSQKKVKLKPANAGVDDRLGIRMVQRNISSIDLLDLISVNPYKSPASLSAMSLSCLARILVDPPRIVDKATVCGKTTVATVGIVFSNTGTRISAKGGGAFCVITIGNFVSGPCVSVLMFGDVYSTFCRSCLPGKVVALVAPKLLPPKNGDDTSISFSVSHQSQFQMVGTARDYGVCKSSNVRAKQPDGSWTANGRCKNYIDKRKCEYCDVHRKQQQKHPQAAAGAESGMTWMQKQRMDFSAPLQNRNTNTHIIIHNKVQSNNRLTKNRLLNPPSPSNNHRLQHPSSSANTAPTNNGRRCSIIPMHMKREHQPLLATTRAHMVVQRKEKDSSNNRLLNGSLKPAPPRKKTFGIVGSGTNHPPTKKMGIARTDDWLKAGTTKRTPLSSLVAQQHSNKKHRSINMAGGGGFDGSVAVPKPSSKLFHQSRAPKVFATSATDVFDEPPREDILQKQSELKKKMRERAVAVKSKKPIPKTNNSQRGSFFDSIEVDQDRVLNAKSRFASEADAENYARKRQIVTELEKQEASKEKSNAKKAGGGGAEKGKNRLSKEWICLTCGSKKFSQYPKSCYVRNHKVKVDRQINGPVSKTEQRTKLHDKSVEDGGLRLGAGLDWSRQRFSRFS